LTSEKTELWHLLPVYPPLALAIAYGSYLLGYWLYTKIRSFSYVQKSVLKKVISLPVFTLCYCAAFIVLSLLQFKIFYHEVIPESKYTPDDVAISKLAGKYPQTIYLADDYLPLAIFYAGKDIKQLSYQPEEINTIPKLFRSDMKDFIVITRNGAPQELAAENIPFKMYEHNNSFSILGR
jgi:hypothetical protein